MLRRKLNRARTADEQLARLEASVTSTEAALVEAQKRGRELLKSQKEQQRLLTTGGSRDESGRKLSELREDIRIAKERLRVRTEANEADAQQIVLAERRCADLQAGMGDLERRYAAHQAQAAAAAHRAELAAAQREARAEKLEAEVEAEVANVEAQRVEQHAQRVKSKVMLRSLKAEVVRLEELLKDVLMERKRGELKARQAQDRARERDRARPERKREAQPEVATEALEPAPHVARAAETADKQATASAMALEEVSLNPHKPLPQIAAAAVAPPSPAVCANEIAESLPSQSTKAAPSSPHLKAGVEDDGDGENDYDDDFDEDIAEDEVED